MKTYNTNSHKTGDSGTETQENTGSNTKPCTVIYQNGETFGADHHWIDGSVVHVYSGAMCPGIARTIPLSSVKHILRGACQ